MKFYTNIRAYGNNLLYIGYENGQRVQQKIEFQPEFYRESKNSNEPFSSYDGVALAPATFPSMKDAKDFLESHKDVMRIYGTDKFSVQYLAQKFHGDISYDFSKIKIYGLDIEVMSDDGFPEVESARKPITAITIHDTNNDFYHVWGVKDYTPHLPNIKYNQFSIATEKEMLQDFISWLKVQPPDIMTGWNLRGFDLPYLIHRIIQLLGEGAANELSPWKVIRQTKVKTQKFASGIDEINYDIYGIAVLDYLDLYKKYKQSQQASYKLGNIAFSELEETKIEFEGSLHNLYETNYQKYVEYNVHDTTLVHRLNKKLRFLELIIQVAYIGKVPMYTDALGTVSYWEFLIYHHLYENKMIPPLKRHNANGKSEQFQGAYVKDPIVGKHAWIASFDLTSLYPSIIRQLEIGPETLVRDLPFELEEFRQKVSVTSLLNRELDTSILKRFGYSMGANGAFFKQGKKSFLSELVEKIFNQRKAWKKQSLELNAKYEITKDPADKELAGIFDIKQHAAKILINACYGAVGNPYFQYYSLDSAEAVTVTGQLIIQWAEKYVNEYLNKLLKTTELRKDYVVAADTDSLYVNLGPLVLAMGLKLTDTEKVLEFINSFCAQKLMPYLDKIYADFFEYTNGHQNLMVMKREIIADTAVFTAKKRYFANVLDSEGVRYKVPKLKAMGVEVVKSSTPAVCRTKLKDTLKIILSGSQPELLEYITKFKEEFKKLSPDEIAFPRSVSDVTKYSTATKAIPIAVRGALNFNRLLKEKGLDKTYELIKDGNKVKYIPLKLPNSLHDSVIAFSDKLPKEFDLDKYVDYEEQFEKAFLSPIREIAKLIKWDVEKKNNMDDLFV